MLPRLQIAVNSSSAPRPQEYGDSEGPSNRPPQTLGLKTERREYEYELICRVCLKEGNMPIFGPEDLSDYLNTIAGVEVTFEDAYPKYLCHSCNSLLHAAILFRQTAQESDQVLKQPGYNDMPLDCQGGDWRDKYMPGQGKESDTINPIKTENLESEDNEQLMSFYCKECDLTFESSKQYDIHKLGEHNLRSTCTVDGVDDTFSGTVKKIKTEDDQEATSWNWENSHLTFDFSKQYDEQNLPKEHGNLNKSNSLQNQINHHQMEPEYTCDICGKTFSKICDFKGHRVIHVLELPFKCTLCPYRGRCRETLTAHMLSHTGEKPFKCPKCPRRLFATENNLNQHILNHNKPFPFQCDLCSQGFNVQRKLTWHVKVDHYGIKKFVCKTCGKAFGYHSERSRHYLNVHRGLTRQRGRLVPIKGFMKKPDVE